MCLLHAYNHVIIHRDLVRSLALSHTPLSIAHTCAHLQKPGNLLIDDSLRVVVADFGLSDQLKRNSQTYDEAGYKGTPHYTAPEVLRGVYFDQSVDVYSFALVLWELFTRRRLWRDLDWASLTVADLRHKLCFENHRPPLPPDSDADWTPRLRQLLARCWDGAPSARDPFTKILKELDEIALEHAVPDDEGRAVWRAAFGGDDTAHWSALQTALGRGAYSEREWEALHALLVHQEAKRMSLGGRRGGSVALEQWGRVLAWLAPGALKTLGARAMRLVSQRWCHGELSVGGAENLLYEQDPGTYLVRFSSVVRGGYCLSHVDKDAEVQHVRILRGPGASYLAGGAAFGTLEEAVAHLVAATGLTRPCPGSLFSMFWTRSPRLSMEHRNASPYRP